MQYTITWCLSMQQLLKSKTPPKHLHRHCHHSPPTSHRISSEGKQTASMYCSCRHKDTEMVKVLRRHFSGSLRQVEKDCSLFVNLQVNWLHSVSHSNRLSGLEVSLPLAWSGDESLNENHKLWCQGERKKKITLAARSISISGYHRLTSRSSSSSTIWMFWKAVV